MTDLKLAVGMLFRHNQHKYLFSQLFFNIIAGNRGNIMATGFSTFNLEGGKKLSRKQKNHKKKLLEIIRDVSMSSKHGPRFKPFEEVNGQITLLPIDEEGNTILHMYADDHRSHFCEMFGMFQYLIKNINPKNKDGFTPLHRAAVIGNLNLSELIIRSIEDKNPGEINGLTPLHLATYEGHLSVCQLIVENISEDCLNPKTLCKKGMTPLHVAANKGYLQIFELLFRKVKDKNPVDNNGETPLHYAAQEGHVAICQLISKSVKTKNPQNKDGKTPLHIAAEMGHLDIFQDIMKNVKRINP